MTIAMSKSAFAAQQNQQYGAASGGGAVLGHGYQPEEVRVSEISREGSSVQHSLMRLDNLMNDLTAKLVPVLMEDKPMPVNSQSSPAELRHRPESPVAQNLAGIASSIEDQCFRIESLLRRLAV